MKLLQIRKMLKFSRKMNFLMKFRDVVVDIFWTIIPMKVKFSFMLFFNMLIIYSLICFVKGTAFYFSTLQLKQKYEKRQQTLFFRYELRPFRPGKITAAAKVWRKFSLNASAFLVLIFVSELILSFSQRRVAAFSMKSFPGLRIALLEHQ